MLLSPRLPAASLAAALMAEPAMAQAPAEKTVESVTITAPREGTRNELDRRSYTLGRDLAAGAGSIADALRNVPSLQIDGRGVLSLRGETGVTILIDGRPSEQFRGDGAAAALAQLPASQFERVEVIPNPPASMTAEGAGGVINLISRRSRGEGFTGQLRASGGDRGRHAAGLFAGYNTPALALTGDLALRDDVDDMTMSDARTLFDPTSGGFVEVFGRPTTHAQNRGLTGRITADYELNKQNRLSAGLRLAQRRTEGVEVFDFTVELPASPSPPDIRRLGRLRLFNDTTDANIGYRRKSAGDGHEFSADIRRDSLDQRGVRIFDYLAGAPAAGPFERVASRLNTSSVDVKADYKRPLSAKSKLAIGYQRDADAYAYDNSIRRGASPGAAADVPAASSTFDYDQTLNAAYITHEQTRGELRIQLGLRLEDVGIDTLDRRSGARNAQSYFEIYPSAHLRRQLTEASAVSASYSRRVTRPRFFDLNPARLERDAYTFFEGNPGLRPQLTDSFDASYEFRQGPKSFTAAAYYRQSDDAMTTVYIDLGAGAVLLQRQNLGQSASAGADLSAGGRLSKTITYNVSANLNWTEIEAPLLGFSDRRSLTTLSGRATLDWQITPADSLQITASAPGDRLVPQGLMKSNPVLNLGYLRKANERLSVVFSATDVFGSAGFFELADTPVLKGALNGDIYERKFTLALTYTLGAINRAPRAGFDYGG